MLNHRDNTIIPKLNWIPIQVLIRVHMIRVSDSEPITLAGHDTKESYEAAKPKTDGMPQWLNALLKKWVGDLEDLYET